MNNLPSLKSLIKQSNKKALARPKPKARKAQKNQRNFQSRVSPPQSVAAAYSNKNVTGKPKQTHNAKGDVFVEHSEFIQDINGSVAFAASGLAVNPGISTTFPWLSQIAPNYESYKFDVLEFTFETSVGSQTAGKMMLAVDYDASDPAPVMKSQIASYQDYASDAPWRSFRQHNKAENLSKRKSYYVRSGPPPANSDIKLYDVGNLFAATQGMTDASIVGELYVKYKVKLMTPQIQNPALGLAKSAAISVTSGGVVSVAPLSSAPLTATGDATTITITASAAYNCIFNTAQNCANTPSITLGGTATRQIPVLSTSGLTIGCASAQVLFLPGQTLTLTNAGVTPGSGTAFFGQFDAANL